MLIWTNTDALKLHPGVGKSTLARRYAEGTFSPQTTRPTLNGSLFTRKLNWEGGEVRLQIWDTVGEERHRSLTKLYYRGAQAAIIVYDITSESSFEDVQTWLSELRNMIDEVLIFIVGAKWDLTKEGKRVV
ncbi:P-loop containing nucleoside triphosphate hydrolase protein, partial [Filobasidium floriforme]|uniref:P-loop containing nucleoside triphosphate hydrolase protein n=1 Tax=Filobasidium floriforme TaxID=5210 RepID=UPI001E8D73FB